MRSRLGILGCGSSRNRTFRFLVDILVPSSTKHQAAHKTPQPSKSNSSCPRSCSLLLAKLLVSAVLAIVLIVAMTWIVLAPVSDEASKAALVIVGTTVGFLFGRETR